MKYKIRIILMILLMIHSCIIPMSCTTVKSYNGIYSDAEQISVDKIKLIHLKSGQKLLVEDTQIRLLKLTNDSIYALVINVFDTTWADKKSYKLNASLDTVMLEDVREMFVKEPDVPMTVFAVVGITAGVLIIAFMIALASDPFFNNVH